MIMTLNAQEVRRLVARVFVEYGAPCSTEIQETFVIGGGRWRGRAYRLAGLTALWHVDEGVLEILDSDRNVLRTINLFGHRPSLRLAA